MATTKELEKRVLLLEAKVAELSEKLAVQRPRRSKKNWLSSTIGSMADYLEFEEVVRLGREWRESFRPPDYEAGTVQANGNGNKRRPRKKARSKA